jgi:pyruvate/2-oxoglutarate dehydrogenase complex dihydrolipoamide dehydrogenase (E3) component
VSAVVWPWQALGSGNHYDLVVIGAGSAGVWAAPFAARLGARVALVEKERIGGDCTNYGCVPSKALLKAAGVAWHLRTADRYGLDPVKAGSLNIDLGRIMAGVRQAIDRVYAFETPEALAQAGVDVFVGPARFEDPHTVAVGEDRRLCARHVLLCTGARPVIPRIPGLQEAQYWTYQTVWQQDRLPPRLLVIGSGPVGVELSQAFSRLGSQVTVFESADRPLPVADAEASAILRQVLEEEGVRFRCGADVQCVRKENSTVIVTDRGEDIEGEALLVAVGRRPALDGLDLERAGVKFFERGIDVDEHLRTTQKHIYACGDVIGSYQFTHYAAWQASIAVRTMLFPGSITGVRPHIPWAVFTDPEVAQCGLTESDARKRFTDREEVQVSRWELDHVDRAVTEQNLRGFIKVVHRPDGKVLGAQIVASRAGDIIQELALAVDQQLTLSDLASSIHVYPTYAIGIQQLAAEVRLESVARSRVMKLARGLASLRRF